MLNCRYCGSTLTEKSYSRAFCSAQCYCADSYRKEPQVEHRQPTAADEELITLREEVERLREAVRQVHALAERGVSYWPELYALVDIHKITKGMVE